MAMIHDETAEEQVQRLATFIIENIPGEPSESQGAVDTAIRLLGAWPPRWPRIYCPTCCETVNLVTDELRANADNDHDALDLMCNTCHFVIATLHAAPAASS